MTISEGNNNSEELDLYQVQQEQINILKAQNYKLSRLLEYVNNLQNQNRNFQVKIQDINMPFWSLVGFMIKVTLASIPAAIIIAVITFLIFALLGGAFGVLGTMLGSLLN